MDAAENGVFIWVGKQASIVERRSAMLKAEGYITAKSLPQWTPVTRVIEGAETVLFKAAFSKWNYEVPKNALSPGATSGMATIMNHFYNF